MIKSLRHFFVSQKLFTAISLVLAVYFLSYFINHFFFNYPAAFFQFLSGFFIMILGSGAFVSLILQGILKKDFDQWEFITLSLLGGLLILPTILLAEFYLWGKVSNWLPMVNTTILWLVAGFFLYSKKTSPPSFYFLPLKALIKHPLFITLFLGVIFTLFQISAYPALPDLDPYKWLYKYTYQFANLHLDYSSRSLAESYTFIGTQLLGLSVFNFFKYVLPFIFISIFFPTYLVARSFEEKTKQWLFLLFSFTSPVILLYAQTPMPQAFLITLAYFFVFLLLHSEIKKDDFFLYAAGFTILTAIFYHEAAIIISAIWIVSVIISRRRAILLDKKILFLVLLLLVSNYYRLKDIQRFLVSWTRSVFSMVFGNNNLNLLYPAQYMNIDKNPMGWETPFGVLKFYGFYMGPLLGLVLIVFLGLFFFHRDFHSFFLAKIKTSVSIVIAFVSFLAFFIIAEILPRFPNIALLPDRAWIFCGIFAFIFLFAILGYIKKLSRLSIVIFVLFLSVNLSGALYINYLKRYLIAPEQWQSAQWIKNNLPENRVFFSYGHKNLLPVHADSILIRIPPETYCGNFQIENFEIVISEIFVDSQLKTNYEPFLKFLESISKSAAKNYNEVENMSEKKVNALSATEKIISQAEKIKKSLSQNKETEAVYPLSDIPPKSSLISVESVYRQYREPMDDLLKNNFSYIYYAQENDQNPYKSRPYGLKTWGMDPCPDGKFLFDLYPEKFKRVYSIEDDKVIIWQIL